MSRPVAQRHVLIRQAAVQQIRALYPNVSANALWRVETVDGGYGRDALHLARVESITGPPTGERLVVWRGQVVGLPRCDYCGQEGHSTHTGTAATCSVRAASAAEAREAQAVRMRAHWERVEAEAAAMKSSGPAPGDSRGTTEPAGADQEPASSTSSDGLPF